MNLPLLRTKLIFNPTSGMPGDSPQQLMSILSEMQRWNLVPEVHILERNSDLPGIIRDAYQRGIHLFVASGGDGTIDSVASLILDYHATLGIIPTGTQNNVALSLGIPTDIPAAVALLRNGQRQKIDIGLANCGKVRRPFLEACSIGLFSALFQSADDIQHGNWGRVGDFLATLVSFPMAEMHMILDSKLEINTQGHVVLVTNMPYIGPHVHISPDIAFDDGLLEVLVFANLSKFDLLSGVVQLAGGAEDPRIQRHLVRRVEIVTTPFMPVLADGFSLGEGPLSITAKQKALALITGKSVSTIEQRS